jgi:ABC-type dipeptide/oligopeptide/nickel transport system ATPase component
MPLLEVQNLGITFRSEGVETKAVQGVSFKINEGEMVALVGESGSGKSVTALSLSRLVPVPPARYEPGSRIIFDGHDVLSLPKKELQKIRGARISYIFQEPSTSLNPVFRIRNQIGEAIRLHRSDVSDVRAEVKRLLDLVGIRDPNRVMDAYPHELSGGMQQRVMIAMAVACHPSLLVADEPTTALDVTIQAQILDLLRDLRKRLGMAVLLITHNLAIVSNLADRVVVMFRGKIVEEGSAREVLKNPQHPYTKALLGCIPKLGSRQRRLPVIDHRELEASL